MRAGITGWKNNWLWAVTAALLAVLSTAALPQSAWAGETVEARVMKWQGGAEAAISLTFDDGTLDHFKRGLPMWEEYGFRVTLGIIQETFKANPRRYPQLKLAHEKGHELANHTTSHPELPALTQYKLEEELKKCHDLLTKKVPDLDGVYTVIYPFELYNDQVIDTLRAQGYLFARSGAQGIDDHAELNDAIDPPFYHLYSWSNENILPMWMWNDTTDSVVEEGGWLIEQCHGIGEKGEDGVGWNPRPEAEYREHYDHIASYGDRIWVAPLGEVGRYIIERNNARVTIEKQTDKSIELNLTDGLDDHVYTVPLTISVKLPDGFGKAQVSQDGTELEPQFVGNGAGGAELRFDAVPDGGLIVINKG